jgi:hypothetical protein
MTITAKAMISERLERGLRVLAIPDHMHAGIRAYVVDHHPVGGFLTALLENNLKESVARADPMNLLALIRWEDLLYNYCPGACQGSPAKVAAWLTGDPDGE